MNLDLSKWPTIYNGGSMDELDPIYYLIRGVERDGLKPVSVGVLWKISWALIIMQHH
jgi:hypothetical protein